MSQPNTTLQKPKPPSTAARNLSLWMYLPRRIPSMSETPTLTLPRGEARIWSRTSWCLSGAGFFFRTSAFIRYSCLDSAARGDFQEVRKRRCRGFRNLRGIVPAPHANGIGCVGLRHEGLPLMPREDAALERRSEEHTSELQSQSNLVCRLLLEKKKKK